VKRELGRVPFHSDFLHVSRFTFHASRFPCCRGEAGLLGNSRSLRVGVQAGVFGQTFSNLFKTFLNRTRFYLFGWQKGAVRGGGQNVTIGLLACTFAVLGVRRSVSSRPTPKTRG